MIEVFTANTPNGVKIPIALEELGVSYQLEILDLSKQEQKRPSFLKINPNGRIPAIIDHDGPGAAPLRVFESGAILFYLAEKFGALLPTDPAKRIDAIAWTYFQTGGIGPMMGQAGYFKRNVPEFEAGFDRFYRESQRLVGVVEAQLTDTPYFAGDDISIADIMHIGWIDRAPDYFGFDLSPYPAVSAWRQRMLSRDGVQRGLRALQ
ncbi:MAG: glutathione binding-like protein [Pseudomonadota bacterium]